MEEENILDALWVEKHRPRTLEDVVLNEEQKIFFSKCLEKGEIPSVLLYGVPGSGKTTIARIVCDHLIKNEMDLLALNGSDQGRIGDIRETVVGFLKSPPYASKHKIVFLDEADGMSIKAQEALRGIMEQYSDTGRFIFTANIRSKISDAIFSRCQEFEFKRLDQDFVFNYATNILKKEEISYKEDTVKLTIENLMPDIRKIINRLQQNVDSNNTLKAIDIKDLITKEKQIISYLVEISDSIGKDFQDKLINQLMPKIQEIVSSDSHLDFIDTYQKLFFYPQLPLWAKIVINRYANQHQGCAIPSINFMAMIYDIISTGIEYFQMVKRK